MNAEKRKTLGRGLNALFGEQAEADPPAGDAAAPAPAAPRSTMDVAVDLLSPSPLQPRHTFDEAALDELTASIRERGVLMPLLVRPSPTAAGRYEIIAGERRWRAAQRAQVHAVPVVVKDIDDGDVLEVALIENLQRQDLSPVEEARGYRRLMEEFQHTQERLSEAVGKSRTHVANTLRLLTLPDGVQALIESGKLTPGQARPLIGLRNAEALAAVVVKRGMSARQAERFAKGFGKTRKQSLSAAPKDADTRALEQTLEQATGYQIDIKFNGEGGTVTIAYTSLEQLDDIARRLSNSGRKAKADEAEPESELEIKDEDNVITVSWMSGQADAKKASDEAGASDQDRGPGPDEPASR